VSRAQAESASDEVRNRLEAWRAEIEAGAVYTLIAERSEERQATILRRMADTEGGHRRRLEQRMTELGIPIPEPASVRLSRWLRLQARIAPIDGLLRAREAAEQDEITERYKKPTGDRATDELLHEIRKDERAPSLAVQEMSGDSGVTPDPSPLAVPGAQARLERILGRERWHRTGGSWISGAIYGANDGLAAVFGIVTGVSGATGGSSFVLTAGLAGAVASAL